MQIDFTKKQLKTLLELVYLGNWMINAQRDGSKKDPIMQGHDDMAKLIYFKAGEAGLDKEVQYSKEMKKWFPTQDFEMDSDVTDFHNEYDNNIFWEELTERLGTRDFCKTYNSVEIGEMSLMERITKKGSFIDKYSQEFANNELERLFIDDKGNIDRIRRNDLCPCGSGKKYKKCCSK